MKRPSAAMQWDVAVVTVLMLVIGGIFMTWRVLTASSCLVLRPSADAWLIEGIQVRSAPGCELADGTVVDSQLNSDNVMLTYADGNLADLALQDSPVQLLSRLLVNGWTLGFVVGLFIICAIGFARRPSDRGSGAFLVFSTALLSSTFITVAGLPAEETFNGWARWVFLLGTQGVFAVAWGAALATAVLFPSSLSPTAARGMNRMLMGGGQLVIWTVLSGVILMTHPRFTALFHFSTQTNSVLTAFSLAATLVVAFVRISRMGDTTTELASRQQLLWVGVSGAATTMALLALWIVPTALVGDSVAPSELIGIPGFIFVAGLAIATFRWRMFELEWLLVKVLVLTGLLLLAVAAFDLVVWLVRMAGLRFTALEAGLIAVVITTVAAVPLRNVLERVANWAIYRGQQTPYQVLSQLSEHLARRSVDFATVAADIARALHTPRVRITAPPVRVSHVSGFPVRASRSVVFPLEGGDPADELVVWTRGLDDHFTSAELHLLHTVSSQIGAAVAHRRLGDQLIRSHEQLLHSREEERKALRRVLHDDVAPTLAGISLEAETARRLLIRDPGSAESVLQNISHEAVAASGQVRELSYDLRPAALDQKGMVPALTDFAARLEGVEVVVDVNDELGELPAAVEVAAFRIAIEALTNVGRHARATHCQVCMSLQDDQLHVVVADDGVGLPALRREGVGMASMHERATELGGSCQVGERTGGGTLVAVRLPLEVSHD
ncbi:sensor histidine kinase [Propionibacterium sp.]|uniref:sensor histidine kinase n=1 Tax=Propionibacterium sp. TaxID=1977903 RepID=UPI0039E84F73